MHQLQLFLCRSTGTYFIMFFYYYLFFVKLRNDFYFGVVHADRTCMTELANPYSVLPCGGEVGGLFKWMTNVKQT